jgi:putative transposase
LSGVRLIISDACLGLVEAAAEVFPNALWQRCVVHWYRNAFANVSRTKVAEVALMLKAIHASQSRAAAEATAERVRATLDAMKLSKLGEWIAATVGETLTYRQFAQIVSSMSLRDRAPGSPSGGR